MTFLLLFQIVVSIFGLAIMLFGVVVLKEAGEYASGWPDYVAGLTLLIVGGFMIYGAWVLV